MKLISVLLLFITSTAFAGTSILTCEFSGIEDSGELYIAVDGLDQEEPNPELNYDKYTAYEGDEAAFSYDGSEGLEWLWSLALSGDGQSVRMNEKGDMEFFLDSDGCDVGVIYLYGNNDFKYGYVSVTHRCGDGTTTTYSKAKCSITKPATPLTDTNGALSNDLLKGLENAWNNADVDATDKYSTTYKSSAGEVNADMIYETLNHEYVEYLEVTPFEKSGDTNDAAFSLAKDLFTADPFIDGESLNDIGPVVDRFSTVLDSESYTVYTAHIGSAFSGSHFSVIVVSNTTHEAVVMTAGYSE